MLGDQGAQAILGEKCNNYVMYKSYKLTRIFNILDKGDLFSIVFEMNIFSSIKGGEAFCLLKEHFHWVS